MLSSTEQIKIQIEEESRLQLVDLQAQLNERKEKLEEANINELAWRKKQGIWITSPRSALALATVLREHLKVYIT